MNSANRPSSKASTTSARASKNTVGVQTVNGMIRLSLPREVSRAAYGIAQKFISPGLEATPLNLKVMEGKANQMSIDIATGNFDITWEKYQLGVVAANKLTSIDGGKKKPKLSLIELYDLYCESRKGSVTETMLELELKGTYKRAIVEAIDKVGEDALAIRNYLVENRCLRIAKESLRYLSKAYQLGIKHKDKTGVTENPFDGMAGEIEISKGNKKTQDNFDDEDGDNDLKAFTVDEMNVIIDAFDSSGHRRHFAPIIKFLFWSGCRTGEAIGLKWRDIKWDKELITIRRTYNHRLKLFKPTKTGTIRFIPMPKDSQLWNLLKSILEKKTDDIVFQSKHGKTINGQKLGLIWRGSENAGYSGVIPELIEQGKVKEYLKLYATRHTFVSHQVNICKVPLTTVAQWVGNGAMVSNNSYLDRDKFVVPGNPNAPTQAPTKDLPSQLVELLASLTPEQIEQLKTLLNK